MFDKDYTYAVIWASNNTQKYGYKVLKDLIDKWYKTIAINPNEKGILWQKVYPNIEWVDKKIDVAIFVVPPKLTETILPQINKTNIKKVWMQPWSESDIAIKFCEKNNIECIHNACIMIQSVK